MTTEKPSEAAQEALSLLIQGSGKRHAFLGENALDHMFTMMMELSSQMWVLKERLYAYESVMAQTGLVPKEAVEDWRPSEAEQDDLAAMRQAMLQDLFRSVLAQPTVGRSAMDDPVPPG